MRQYAICPLLALWVGLAGSSAATGAGDPVLESEMAGYLLVPHDKVPEEYNAGFSMYVAAWPLLSEYPGNRFQTGLFGTWMFAQNDGPEPERMYSDIEGGLGWRRDTRFATPTPKFIMGGVALNFSEWANGPGAGKGRDWDKPLGKYGVAQLSPWILWPPDGLNLKQGTCGELVGYGYLPLPLTNPKPNTAGKNVPTGDHSWTLFLNTKNFKGPVAFFTPYFFSRETTNHPKLAGMFLDSRPSRPNKALQMETQYVPAVTAKDDGGEIFARIAPTSFPRDANGDSVVVHRMTAYKKQALWDAVKTWFEGGPPATGVVDPEAAIVYNFESKGGSTWKIQKPGAASGEKVAVDWKSFASPVAIDPHTFGYRWDFDKVSRTETNAGLLATLPEYFHLVNDTKGKSEWVVVAPRDVPPDTGLRTHHFRRPDQDRPEPYTTPDDPKSVWKTPGPVAGPYQVRLGDASVVTYFWYRFADQPAMLNADLTIEEREGIQKRVENLHRTWTREREYLPPPTIGKLAELDPALIVTPPPGFEAGYVPIVTRQAAE